MLLRKAKESEIAHIWKIVEGAIERRRLDGSEQWQNGYPDLRTIQSDFENGFGYVVDRDDDVVGYGAIIFDDEPAYNDIKGKWLSSGSYVVVHRLTVSSNAIGKGVAKFFLNALESLAIGNQVHSTKVDTNFDNVAMLHILNKLGYTYCCEVLFSGSYRMAFEKMLK